MFGLEFVLVTLTFVSGVVAAWYAFSTRSIPVDERPVSTGFVELCRSFFPVLLLVLVLRSFVFEPFKIPSGSMIPTLLEGDFIFVSKFSYGVRLPLIHTKILENGGPERGDVAVFRLPSNPKINYIKRVIGLPGDSIVYRQGMLRINGEPIELEPTGERYDAGKNHGVINIEHLFDRPHAVLDDDVRRSRDYAINVPDGCYFMMGDNRDNSTDSRFPSVGCIDEKFLVGRAGRVWFNFDWGSWPRWSRIGQKIE
ncbi:MAG: signal peptidase I [Pseudomonadota bacterium]